MEDKIQWALEIFNDNGITTNVENGYIVISHYAQPKNKTFEQMGINEDELIEHVGACLGCFDFRNSALTTFPLLAAKEIRLYENNNIKEFPNLKIAGAIICNSKLKRLPKLKKAISITMNNSSIKTLPKLKEVDILTAENSKLESIPNLTSAKKLCIIDTPIVDLNKLEKAQDIFICSSNEEEKVKIASLESLELVDNLFVANSELKALPKLKKAQKIALYNSKIKSIKKSIKAEIEIATKITDEQLSDKFDSFTDWYNSDIIEQSMNMLGNIVNQIKE